ncbi:MAG TPA: cell division protein ZipA C-terminal FtsZ-binding domain-containing protein, partial [Chloroflexota bacterium]|nr:cell division protein ZipA C-terminal FtsZ-binding domain-containing protein [Chloroflexota bacterium]
DLVSFGADGMPEFVIRRLEDPQHKAGANYYPGLTFAMDLPHVNDPAATLKVMVGVAESFAAKLGGQVVDDNRRPLTEAGLASIRRSLEKVVNDMEAHGVPAGSALARRLFA